MKSVMATVQNGVKNKKTWQNVWDKDCKCFLEFVKIIKNYFISECLLCEWKVERVISNFPHVHNYCNKDL